MSREPQYGRRRKAAEQLAAEAPDLSISRGHRYFPFIIGAVAFLIYIRTMTPAMQMGDGTELATAAHVLGIPHPTGYPLYMLLSKLWLLVTVAGDAIMRMTVLNALLMAAAVGLTGTILADLLRAIWKKPAEKSILIWAGAGALTLAFLRFHWGNAVVTEVYALQFLLMLVFTRAAQKLDAADAPNIRTPLLLATACLALAIAHHRLSVTLLLPWLAVWVLAWRQRRHAADTPHTRLPFMPALLILLAGASLYAYLPLRAAVDPPVNWGNPDSPARFYNHVRGTEYLERGLLKPALGHSFSPEMLKSFVQLQTSHLLSDAAGQFAPFREQFQAMPGGQKVFVRASGFGQLLGLTFIVIAAIGMWLVWRSGARWTAFTAAAIALQNVGILYIYNIPDIRDYFLYSFWTLWLGVFAFAAWLARHLAPERRLLAGYLFLLLPATVLLSNWRANDRSDDISAELLSATILPESTETVVPGSILITDDDAETFTTWYRQKVRRERTDVLNFAGNFVYMPWYETFFSETQLRDYKIKLAGAVARSAAEYARQLREGIIDANIEQRQVFTSINDPAVLSALADTYTVEPVDVVEVQNRGLFDDVSTTVLYRISIKERPQ